MKIERVDDKTIKCYLSKDELAYYQVDYSDFISRTENAQRLLREIIETAKTEVGYHPPKIAFEMQIMMVPEQGMVLTFSEKDPALGVDPSKLGGFIDTLKQLLEHVKEESGGTTGALGALPGLGQGGLSLPAPSAVPSVHGGEKQQSAPAIDVNDAIFMFTYLADFMDYAQGLPRGIRIDSTLYKMGQEYYLHISRGKASYDRFSRSCVQALEFSQLYSAGPGCDEVLKEHGEVMIATKAVNRFRK
ncbi:MAG: adaptor protein MecA [Lachnospiraceae bacterium]|jgi:adapter protein MecA 1/2|nr:adaptor protein MecA [Lachnospiraceae bacterium]MBO7363570.1 adaptor protein MecA [Lachnospiraceae bacterium]MBP5252270.1 adaptor protein MecA [Lachnospiraceae bacterium]MBP5472772.1 adaptor protein MecA [Lachnospiraceae bacterium]MBP5762297.1 adaptor protein MecA [Lachnospiraceae bacterium]